MAKYGYNKVKFMNPNYNATKEQYEKYYDSFLEKYDGMLETKAGKVKTPPLRAFEILCFNAKIEEFIHGNVQGSRRSTKTKDTNIDGKSRADTKRRNKERSTYFQRKPKKLDDSKATDKPDRY